MNGADKDKMGLEGLAGKLGQAITGDHLANIWEGCQLPGRDAVAQVLDQLLSVLFPGVFGNQVVREDELGDFILESLASVRGALSHHIAMALDYRSSLARPLGADDPRCGTNAALAGEVTVKLLEQLPLIRQVLGLDLLAAYEGDPAAGSVVEVLMSYPFVQAISVHRIAHELYKADVPLIPRMMSEVAHSRTGSDIHPGAVIGPGFFIDHGTGVVIGETTVIGRGVKLYQGVTLGALSFPKDKDGNPIKGIKRHPNIEDGVTIYAGATVLGGETTIGKGSVIGGNCWITSSVPPETVVMSERAQRKHK
ncbi:MAG: serine O-acetyltransferase [Fibrobacteres bacterium]|nr:serine O-acetyltransferase [Fibrobacterota bacterium]